MHDTLDDKAYTRLKTLILERKLLPGARIDPARLAREMGVSRTPVVSALKRLTQERVVEWVPRRGLYVRRFTKREMARLSEVREVLEGLSARLAASRIDPEDVDRLTEMFRHLDLTPTPEAAGRYIEADRYFHGRLVEIAGNEQLAAAMESVSIMIFAYQEGPIRPIAETVQEHWSIIDALRRRDPEASEAAMRLHIRKSVAWLDQQGDAEESGVERFLGPGQAREHEVEKM